MLNHKIREFLEQNSNLKEVSIDKVESTKQIAWIQIMRLLKRSALEIYLEWIVRFKVESAQYYV